MRLDAWTRIGALTALLAFLFAVRPLAAETLVVPPDFVVDDAVPGVTFDLPTSIAFLPGGRMLVGEKRGRVRSVRNGVLEPTPMWSGENEVLNVWDRGLLAIAVDPNYVTNHFIYLLYTVDLDSNGVDDNDNAFGRLTRYRVSTTDSNVVDPSSRTILMGYDWPHGPLSDSQSHTIGSLRFGRDGSLLVSIGDGASFTQMDAGGLDPAAFGTGKTSSNENIGAFRAQDVTSLCGKILRINPATGHGYMSNPYHDSDLASVRSRVWAYGMRNPFRFCLRPGTGSTDTSAANPGTIYIGDVGWTLYEEMNVVRTGGVNLGWPCYEGFPNNSQYKNAHPSHHACNTIGSSSNPGTLQAPVSAWHHDNVALSTPTGFKGNTSIGGIFYTGTRYPAQYRGAYYFNDYSQNWGRFATFDGADQMTGMSLFGTGMEGQVDFAADPQNGDLYWVALGASKIRRLRWTGVSQNSPPVASAHATPNTGVVPLQVQFSSSGSSDPDGDPITRSWTFGDGTGSNAANPAHTFPNAATYTCVLAVEDTSGGITRDTVVVIAAGNSNFPTTGVLDGFNRANGPIGGAWVDETAGLNIVSNQLAPGSGASTTVWNGGTFGPNQEAYITLDQVTANAPEHDLMLKVQGTSWSSGHIEVRYDATVSKVFVSTYSSGTGWQSAATLSPMSFQAGDRFGARAYQNGTVDVFKNGVLMGSATLPASWPYTANGGRLGMTIVSASSSRLDDFGGGNANLSPNAPPQATIDSPVDGSFFAAGDSIHLAGTATDAETPAESIEYHWVVNLLHNNHVHPGAFVSDGRTAAFVAENHEDGTGVSYQVQLQVTDGGGLRDTATVTIHPAIDLTPTPVVTMPSTPGTTAPAHYRFAIRNDGPMPAAFSRWVLRAGATLLAEGDTAVAPHDSVVVERDLDPVLAAGVHPLRVVVDSLGAVVETDESNNAVTRALTVVDGPGPDEVPPVLVTGPLSEPGATTATVSWSTNETTTGVVRYGTTLAFGDSATAWADTTHAVILDPLTQETRYYYQVVFADLAGNAASAPVDSFLTTGHMLAADDAPPTKLALSNAFPNPSAGAVTFALDLPRAAEVGLTVFDLQGRVVWSEPRRAFAAGRWRLGWRGRDASGTRVHTGLYFARAEVDGRSFMRRVAMLR